MDGNGTCVLAELNIANYDDCPGWEGRLPVVVDALTACAADVAALCEIRYTAKNPAATGAPGYWSCLDIDNPACGYQDTGELILSLLRTKPGYEESTIVTNPAMVYSAPPEPEQWEGLSIISRLPVVASGVQCLEEIPGNTDGNQRATQYAEVVVSGGARLFVFNTHFSLDSEQASANARETISMIERIVPSDVTNVVLAGDLNAIPTSPAVAALEAAGFQDAWASLNPGDPGYTYPMPSPTRRIDYVWVTGGATATQASRIALEPVDGVYASDHCGLCVALSCSV